MPDKTRKKRPEKREAPISYRPPSDLRDEFRARVEKSGLSVSAFITKAIFDKAPPRASRRPPVEQKTLAQILARAAAINDQLSRIDDSDEHNRALLEQAAEELALIRAALLKNMGRPGVLRRGNGDKKP